MLIIIIVSGCATTRESPPPIEPIEEDIVAEEAKRDLSLEKQVDGLYDKAYQSYLNGDYENAVIGFESARLLQPDKMQFWRKLALSYCFIATGRYAEAKKLTLSLIKEKPNYWKSYMHMGLIYLWKGGQENFLKAAQYFLKAEEFQDVEPSVNLYLGMAYQLMNRPTLAKEQFLIAEKDYEQIIKNNPEMEQSYLELAYLYLYSNQKQEEILKLLDRAQQLISDSDNPEKKQIWMDFYLPHLRGIWFYKEGKYSESINQLVKALASSPSGIRIDLAESYYYLGKNYLALKNEAKARYFFEKAIHIDKLVLYQKEIRSFLKTSKKN